MKFIRVTARKRSIKRAVALGFLVVMFIELGSHALPGSDVTAHNIPGWSTCYLLHQTSPSADCPHKRHPFGPESAAMDQVSHHWVLAPEISFAIRGIVYKSPGIERDVVSDITRALSPPLHPPKQA